MDSIDTGHLNMCVLPSVSYNDWWPFTCLMIVLFWNKDFVCLQLRRLIAKDV